MTDKILIDRSVVEQALEALFMYKPMVTGVTFQHGLDAMQALRAALEQPQVEQSSVVGVSWWKNPLPNSGTVVHWTARMPPLGTKLYTHPQPPRRPLTDQQINDHRLALAYYSEDLPDPWDFKQGVRAAERAHGIGGEA